MDATARGARAELQALPETFSWHATFPPLPRESGAHDASVLMLFGPLDDVPADAAHPAVARDLDVLLQRRAPTLSSHPGQVSFPGGRAEPSDGSAAATALREAEEETGLDPSGVDVLGTLPAVPLAVSNHRVTPVLAWWRAPSRVAAVDHAETVDVFRVPVADLLDPANRFTAVHTHENHRFRAPAFDVGGVIVWGFTAMVLHSVFEAADWSLPWDASRERPV